MSNIVDRLTALGRGAAQGASGGWSDELSSSLLAAMPLDDGTGIPREYAGAQDKQYLSSMRADNADSQRKFPLNYGVGQLVGGAPAAAATLATGGLPAVGAGVTQGALTGAGSSERGGVGLARDTASGAALGGAFGAGGNLAQGLMPTAKSALQSLRDMPPPSGGLQPAMSVPRQVQKPLASPPGQATLNFNKPVNSTQSFPSMSPSLQQAEQEARAALSNVDFKAPSKLPKPAKVPVITDEEASIAEQRLRQTEEAWAKRHDLEYGAGKAKAEEIRATPTVKPGKVRPR